MATMIVDDQRTKVQREPRRELRKRPTWMTVDDGLTKLNASSWTSRRAAPRSRPTQRWTSGDGFQLALVPEHTTRQSCEVVWRRGKTYGVKFLS
ncbi:hypothetical protein ACF1BQ_022670 [Bradyrhizobium sp. RDT10]